MKSLRALIVDDSKEDTIILANELKKAGYSLTHARVDSQEEMERALEESEWDIVFCDHVPLRFDPHFATIYP